MKIDNIRIKNVKSFRDEISIDFNKDLNILVGPNGGGKSNLLDIINVILKSFFFNSYKIEERNIAGSFHNVINSHSSYDKDMLENILDKFMGDKSDSFIEITLEITDKDIENINTIQTYKNDFEDEISTYMNNPIPSFEFFHNICLDTLKPGQKVVYSIRNNNLDAPTGNVEKIYLQYLQYFDLFVLLAKKMDNININSICMYFSPYRGNDQLSQINLSDNFYNYLIGYLASTSKKITSLIQLATLFFVQKRLEYGYDAKNEGYWDKWIKDKRIMLINENLSKLGYSWDLDKLTQTIFKIILIKDSRKFYIEQASSGEKEIINFLFGIATFYIENGLIIIDEPELHLHPKWQIILMDLFTHISKKTGNQFILSTHSPVFINNKTISNIIRVYMNENVSNVVKIDNSRLDSAKDLLHMINSYNNEKMFFADKVVLVEGIHDRIIFEKLIKLYSDDNTEVIEVLEVGGKHNLEKYMDFLNNIKVKNFIIADLDYLSDIGDQRIKELFKTNYKKIKDEVIKKKSSKDGGKLAEELENAINTNNMDKLTEIWEYIKSRNRKIKDTLTKNEEKSINDFIDSKKLEGIFILKEGELENYLPEGYKSKDSEKIIDLTRNKNFSNWWKVAKDNEKGKEMHSIVSNIINHK